MHSAAAPTRVRLGALPDRPNRIGGGARNRPNETGCGAFGRRSAFLTERIEPVYAAHLPYGSDEGSAERLTPKSYRYLRDSYVRYARLLGRAAPHDGGRSVGEGIHNLYRELQALVGPGIGVNVERQEGRLCFVLYRRHEWPGSVLFWFPLRFIEGLDGALRRLAVSFVHSLLRANRIWTIEGTYEWECCLDWLASEADECDDAERKKELRALVACYGRGKARRLMLRVERTSYYQNLEAALARYTPRTDAERELTALMREGLEFASDAAPALTNYAYDPDAGDPTEDDLPVGLEQQICAVYDAHDLATEYALDLLNSTLYDRYALAPVSAFELSPATEELFVPDDYPERFAHWAGRFIAYTASIPNER